MVCHPNAVYNNSDSDKEKIIKFIKGVNKSDNFNFYYSKYLPTIRGCIVYGKNNEPIWNCVQTYSYTDDIVFSSAQYENSYAIVGRKEQPYILKNNTEIIEKEFDRLKFDDSPIPKS